MQMPSGNEYKLTARRQDGEMQGKQKKGRGMAKYKLVYDPKNVKPVSFKEGWEIGKAAIKSGFGNVSGRIPSMIFWTLWGIACAIPLVGLVVVALFSAQSLAALMRFEQLMLVGRPAGFSDMTKMMTLDRSMKKVSLYGFAAFIALGIAYGIIGFIPVLGPLVNLAMIPVFVVVYGVIALTAWSVALQKDDDALNVDKMIELAKKTWPALCGLWLPVVIFGMVAGIAFLIVSAVLGFGKGAAGGAVGVGGMLIVTLLGTLVMVLAMLAMQSVVLGQGYHLLARKALMKQVKIEEEQAEVVSPVPSSPWTEKGVGTLVDKVGEPKGVPGFGNEKPDGSPPEAPWEKK